MPLLSSTRDVFRRLNDPDHPFPAVAAMVVGSLVLFGSVLVALPSPASAGSDQPVVDVAPLTTSAALIEGPTQLVLPEPSGDVHEATTIVNHQQSDVAVTAQLANGEGLTVELGEAGPRATHVLVTSTAVHQCGHYAGSLILEATHPTLEADLLVLDVRFAECAEEPSTVALAPDSVNDLEPTWADEGTAPWKPRRPVAPPPPPEPTEPEPTTESEPTAEEQDTSSPKPKPDDKKSPKPEPKPEPTPTATAEPTVEPEPEPEPEPTTTASTPTDDGDGDSDETDGGSTDGGASEPTSTTSPASATSSPSPSETTTTEGSDG